MTDELPEEATAEPAAPPPPALPPEPESRPPRPAGPPLPGSVTASAVLLLIFGTLAAFGGALSLLWSLFAFRRWSWGFDGGPMMRGLDDNPMMPGWDGGGWAGLLFVVLAVAFVAAVAGGHLAAGWAILQRLAWGRILGMVVSGVALVVLALGLVGTLAWAAAVSDLVDQYGSGYWVEWFRNVASIGVTVGALVTIAIGAGYAFILWVLARHGEVFEEPSPATAPPAA